MISALRLPGLIRELPLLPGHATAIGARVCLCRPLFPHPLRGLCGVTRGSCSCGTDEPGACRIASAGFLVSVDIHQMMAGAGSWLIRSICSRSHPSARPVRTI
jgi:hypothetical protein